MIPTVLAPVLLNAAVHSGEPRASQLMSPLEKKGSLNQANPEVTNLIGPLKCDTHPGFASPFPKSFYGVFSRQIHEINPNDLGSVWCGRLNANLVVRYKKKQTIYSTKRHKTALEYMLETTSNICKDFRLKHFT